MWLDSKVELLLTVTHEYKIQQNQLDKMSLQLW